MAKQIEFEVRVFTPVNARYPDQMKKVYISEANAGKELINKHTGEPLIHLYVDSKGSMDDEKYWVEHEGINYYHAVTTHQVKMVLKADYAIGAIVKKIVR